MPKGTLPDLLPKKGPNKAWLHNQMGGYTRMMEMQLRHVIEADSVTPRGKRIATQMLDLLGDLREELKIRL